MSLSPVAFIAPNYRDFKGDWIKFYQPGTTTPKTIYLDGTGLSAVSKIELNADGFMSSAGGAIVTPYIEGAYDAYIFASEQSADSNDTNNAVRIADNLEAANGGGNSNAVILVETKNSQTLLSGQTIVTFLNTVVQASSVYINGTGSDDGRIHETEDYILRPDINGFTIQLNTSYAQGTIVTAYNYGLTSAGNIATRFLKYKLSDLVESMYDYNIGIGVWAHRGLKGYAPENTIAAIYNSLNKGHKAVEGDISWTSDNVAIIMHDTTVNRTTNGTGNVADLTLAQIETLDAGSWFSSIYKNEKVPTFEQWFDSIIANGGIPTIEIKEGGNSTQENMQLLAARCIIKNPSNRYMYLVRNPTTFGWIRDINPFANMIYFPNTGEPSVANADFVESQGNCSLHLDAEYATNFDFSPYTFPITALNEPNTQDLREASARGFVLIGTDNYIGSNI
jgi:hypothetical protein